ncbi:cytochrome P450 [Trichoderma gracile]
MSASAASVRFITADTVIGGKILRKDNNRLLIPFRQLHFDKTVFGETADSFDHERFLERPGLTQSSTWRPFGGGGTMSPGRHAANRCVLLFVVLLLQRFDMEADALKVRVTARRTFA